MTEIDEKIKVIETDDMQVLTFNLSEEIFAVEISMVKEVLEYTKITKVPNMPEYMLGVINLRGNVVPVIDLRNKFDMNEAKRTVNTAVIIVELPQDEDMIVIGALVDSVREVSTFARKEIDSAPKIGTKLNTEFLKGMAKLEEGFVMILDIDKIFTFEELGMLAEKMA